MPSSSASDISGKTHVAWQQYDDLGELAGFSLDIDPAAILLDNNVMRHRKPEPRSFTRRLGRKKGFEHLLSHVGRDAGAVVADVYFNSLAKIPGHGAEE